MNIIENKPLAKHTTFKVGGPTKYFCVVKTIDEIKEALAFATEKNIDYFLQLPSGEQVFITGTVDSSHRPAECVFGTRCGWWYDIADLSADFFLNGVTPDEPVIVSPVTIEVK